MDIIGAWPNLWNVIRRELRIWSRRPIYLLGSVGVIAFCAIFFLTFFRDGLPHDLPIAVVDNDNSSTSRNFVRQLDATQLGKVVQFDTFAEAREEMQRGKVYGICVIPENFNADIQAFRRPTFHYYLNGLYMVGGALAYKDILTMINLTNGAVQREMFRAKGMNDAQIMNMIQPIIIDTHQIGNVYTNYGYYLSNMLLPAILTIVITIVLLYSFGAELKYGTSKHLIQTAGGSIIVAVAGKLIVYTILFSTLGFILMILLYHIMHFPIAGSIFNMFIAIFLLVISSEAVALLIIECLPVPRLALSIGALYSVLGISLSGFTLPAENLPSFVQGWAECYPLRHYYLFYVQEVIYGAGFAGWWPQVILMLLFLFVPMPLLKRLKSAYILRNYPVD